MSDDGTTFTIDLPVRGQAQVDAAAASVDVLANRLEGTSKASEASGAAIKAAEAAYSKAEQSADRAAKALERVGIAADVQRGKLRAASEANDSGAAEKAAAKLRDLVAEQDVLATHAAKTTTALKDQAVALDKIAKPKAAPKEEGGEFKFEGLERGLHKLGGPLAETAGSVVRVGAGFEKLTKSLGAAGPYVAAAVLLVALSAALVSAGVAAVFATAKIAAWAVGLADANRSASLLAQGIARSVDGGALLDDKISDLNKQLPLTREELSATAQRLADAGYRGKALADALQTSAVAAAKLKFGPGFQEEMLSLNEQSKVFHANLAEIFGGLKVEGLLGALQKLVGLFDADNASGRAMKVVFESLFQPIIDWLEKSEPKIEAFFLQMEIWALKALIAIKPHASIILHVGEAFAIVAGLIGGVLVVAIGLLVGALALPFALFAGLVFAVIQFKDTFFAAFGAVKAWLSSFSLADVGKAIVAGLADGIKSGGGAVLEALKGTVMGAVDGVKNVLGIHSPSTVLDHEVGEQMGAGAVRGIDRVSPRVQNSLENMVEPPAARASTSSSSSSSSVSISGNTFILNGVADAEEAESRIGALLTRLIEGDVAQLGAAVPA